MKRFKLMLFLLCAPTLFLGSAVAGDFSWLKNLNVSAKADLPGYRHKLAYRFNVDAAEIKMVMHAVKKPSDAYMIFRLKEMTHRAVDDIVYIYRHHKKHSWRNIAKKLGIKHGSHEYYELTERHDL